ncbi:MAG: hypothetical protein NC394_02880 [Bacteroides sp.]|nr:hypothetical protein [Bacteroides sp.]
MKKRKFPIYIAAIAAAVMIPFNAYAIDVETETDPSEETTVSSESTEPAIADTSGEQYVDPFNPSVSESSDASDTEPQETGIVVDPTYTETDPILWDTSDDVVVDPFGTEDTSAVEETTPEDTEPQISLDTAPATTTEELTETQTTTAAPAAEPVTEAVTVPPETEPYIEETTTETPYIPEETTAEETTTTSAPAVIRPDGSNSIGADAVPGDPDSFITIILLIAGAIVLFILILIIPPIFRKIKKSIIYKYD